MRFCFQGLVWGSVTGRVGFRSREVVGMNSSLIGKIEKARMYASEPERITIDSLRCQVRATTARTR